MNVRHRSVSIAAIVCGGILAVLLAALFWLRPLAVDGAKTVTVTVIDDHAVSTVYTVHTDALYLRDVMEEAEGLTFEGQEGPYGIMVESVNGLRAVYELDGAYWGFFAGETYCDYGIDTQPVNDGDAFRIVYTKADVWS